MNFNRFLYKYQMQLSIILVIAGAIMFFFGFFDVLIPDHSPEVISDFTEKLGNWTYWLLGIGGFLLLIFGWFLIDRTKKVKEFNELMESGSKRKFIKNIARIETLALSLGPKYENRVMEKEDEYNIKR
ncbi:MAG: DUF3198 domain-containing protein [Thermoplasmata archaeon]